MKKKSNDFFHIFFIFGFTKNKKQTIHSLTPAHSATAYDPRTAKDLIGRPKSPVRNTNRVYPEHEEV